MYLLQTCKIITEWYIYIASRQGGFVHDFKQLFGPCVTGFGQTTGPDGIIQCLVRLGGTKAAIIADRRKCKVRLR